MRTRHQITMALRKTDNQHLDLPTETDIERPAFELSLTQMIAGTAAAVTAALLGSRLGVAGTIIGAALASAVSMIAGAIYSHSIKAAKHRVLLTRIQHQEAAAAPTSALNLPTGVMPVGNMESDSTGQAFGQAPPALMPLQQLPHPRAGLVSRPAATAVHAAADVRARVRRRLPSMVLAGIGALAAFGMSLILLTGIETVSGNPVSGGQPGGLTILGGQSTGQPDQPAVDSPATSDSSTTEPTAESSTSESSTGTSGTSGATQPTDGSGSPSTSTDSTTTVTETVPPSQDESAGSNLTSNSTPTTSSSGSTATSSTTVSPTSAANGPGGTEVQPSSSGAAPVTSQAQADATPR